jgi:hypothetical protein
MTSKYIRILDTTLRDGEQTPGVSLTPEDKIEIARQLGKLGVDVTVGWQLDTFGHHAQMPQLLKLAGYKSYWFQRGVHGDNTPSEFLWEGIDGTRIPAFWLPLGYGMFYPTPNSLFEFDRYARQQWDALGSYSRWPERVAVAGADVIVHFAAETHVDRSISNPQAFLESNTRGVLTLLEACRQRD